jgi:hypothetical protein
MPGELWRWNKLGERDTVVQCQYFNEGPCKAPADWYTTVIDHNYNLFLVFACENHAHGERVSLG